MGEETGGDEVWTPEQVAEYFHVTPAAVKRGGTRRRLPWFKVAGQLRVYARDARAAFRMAAPSGEQEERGQGEPRPPQRRAKGAQGRPFGSPRDYLPLRGH